MVSVSSTHQWRVKSLSASLYLVRGGFVCCWTSLKSLIHYQGREVVLAVFSRNTESNLIRIRFRERRDITVSRMILFAVGRFKVFLE